MSRHSGHDESASGTRPLSRREKELLAKLLDAKFLGRDELLWQARRVMVRAMDRNGSLEFILTHDRPAPVAHRVPVEAEVDDSDGVTIHVLLHVVGGMLRELEIYREDSKDVQHEPDPKDLRVTAL